MIRHLRGGVAVIGTASEFATANPVLLDRQLSIETDTGVQKIGDGTTAYSSLTALPGGGGGAGGYTPGSDWILAFGFAQTQVVVGGFHPAFVSAGNPPPRGTALSWSEEDPTAIHVNVDGIYDVAAKLWLNTNSDTVDTASAFCEIFYDSDATDLFDAFDTTTRHISSDGQPIEVKWSLPGVQLAAGKTLKFFVQSQDPALYVAELAMMVNRIA